MSKRYEQHCPVAQALDVVGERWALLIVRNLLLGPLRFTDLLGALPKMGTRMLSDRLKNLSEAGVVASRELPPPASTVAYALTERGFELAPVISALADWGGPLLTPGKRAERRDPDSAALMLWNRAQKAKRPPSGNVRLEIGERSYVFQFRAGEVRAQRGELAAPDSAVAVSTSDAFALLEGSLDVRRALDSERLKLSGQLRAPAFRELFGLPRSSEGGAPHAR